MPLTITKIGHCCLLIKTTAPHPLTILTDPGCFSVNQNTITGIDLILITHEHGDHLHVDSLKQVLANNPQAKVITNSAVGKQLDEQGIAYTLLEGTSATEISGVSIAAHDAKHVEIFEDFGQVQNTGYFIADTLFYPGDAYCIPGKPVEVLALPVGGPWCKVLDAIRYALAVKPKKAFPVHDGQLQPDRIGGNHRVPNEILTKNGIEFVAMTDGDTKEF